MGREWHNGGMSVFQTICDAFGFTSPVNPNAIRVPLTLHAPAGGVPITLRTMSLEDAAVWNDLYAKNSDWLKPWASGDPMHGPSFTFNQWVQRQRRDEQQGTGVIFLIEYQMRVVGKISLGAIAYGSMRTGVVGYWVAQEVAGRGIAPMALAMLADWAIADPTGPKLHRLEIAILPNNERSLAVVRKVGARHEGSRPGYIYVDGQWRTHETFSLLAEDMGQGFAARLISRHARKKTMKM